MPIEHKSIERDENKMNLIQDEKTEKRGLEVEYGLMGALGLAERVLREVVKLPEQVDTEPVVEFRGRLEWLADEAKRLLDC